MLLQIFQSHRSHHHLHLGQCYRKFLLLLTKRYQEAIAFVYVKNDTLFLALKHPGFKMEFELASNKELFLQLWQMLGVPCNSIELKNVKAFYSTKYQKQEAAKRQSRIFYQERATGAFKINALDDEIMAHFERIKALIKERHD